MELMSAMLPKSPVHCQQEQERMEDALFAMLPKSPVHCQQEQERMEDALFAMLSKSPVHCQQEQETMEDNLFAMLSNSPVHCQHGQERMEDNLFAMLSKSPVHFQQELERMEDNLFAMLSNSPVHCQQEQETMEDNLFAMLSKSPVHCQQEQETMEDNLFGMLSKSPVYCQQEQERMEDNLFAMLSKSPVHCQQEQETMEDILFAMLPKSPVYCQQQAERMEGSLLGCEEKEDLLKVKEFHSDVAATNSNTLDGQGRLEAPLNVNPALEPGLTMKNEDSLGLTFEFLPSPNMLLSCEHEKSHGPCSTVVSPVVEASSPCRTSSRKESYLSLPKRKKPYECNQCGKSFKHKSNLTDHLRTHTGKKIYECNQRSTLEEKGKLVATLNLNPTDEPKLVRNNADSLGMTPKEFLPSPNMPLYGEHEEVRGEYNAAVSPVVEASSPCLKPFRKESYLSLPKRKKSYECKQCGKSFKHKSNLTDHLRTHTEKKTYECNQRNTLEEQGKLVATLNLNPTDEPKLVKNNADSLGMTPKEFLRSPNMPFYGEREEVRGEYNAAVSPVVEASNSCLKPFRKKSNLSLPKRKKSYECKQCGKSFKHKSNLIDHVRTHTGERTYEFNQRNTLEEQGKLVATLNLNPTDEPKLVKNNADSLGMTPKEFLMSPNMPLYGEREEVHCEYNTAVSPVVEASNSCLKPFRKKSNLSLLKRKKSYECKQCGKSFKHKSNLTDHLRTHTGERTYEFNQRNTLEEQGKLVATLNLNPTDEPKLVRNNADSLGMTPKEFLTSPNMPLYGEREEVRGEYNAAVSPVVEASSPCRTSSRKESYLSLPKRKKSYECKQCGKSFKHKSNLTDHLRTHIGKKTYECNQRNTLEEQGKLVATLNLNPTDEPKLVRNNADSLGMTPKEFLTSPNMPLYGEREEVHGEYNTAVSPVVEASNSCLKPFRKESYLSLPKRKKPYECKQCGKSFKHKSNLTDHLRTHTGERTYEFNQRNTLEEQGKLVATLNLNPTDEPKLVRNNADSLGMMPKEFLRSPNMPLYGKREEVRGEYNVAVSPVVEASSPCLKPFRKKSNPILAKRKKREKQAYECNYCAKSFKDKTKLTGHLRSHTGERPYKCNRCGKSFIMKSHLTFHERTHTGETPYECNECGKSFKCKRLLTEHQRTHRGERPYECEQCGKSFTRSQALSDHKKIHTGEKAYECKICGKSFNYKTNYNVHQRTHTGEKRYECEKCGKAFTQKSNLNVHQKIHTGERSYECKECGKFFQCKRILNDHQRTHTGEKPYKCKECEKSYAHRTSLITHQRTHTGEKPYKCDKCGKAYTQKQKLTAHQNKHRTETL